MDVCIDYKNGVTILNKSLYILTHLRLIKILQSLLTLLGYFFSLHKYYLFIVLTTLLWLDCLITMRQTPNEASFKNRGALKKHGPNWGNLQSGIYPSLPVFIFASQVTIPFSTPLLHSISLPPQYCSFSPWVYKIFHIQNPEKSELFSSCPNPIWGMEN